MFNETKRLTSYSHKISQKLECISYENATVVPSNYFFSGGVLDSNGESIKSSAFNEKFTVGEVPARKDSIERLGNAIYLGFLHNVWGHCLMDSLKKLWFLYTKECQSLLLSGASLIYITPNNEPLSERTIEFLKLANVPVDKLVHIVHYVSFKKIYIPDNSLICKLTPKGQDEYFFTEEFVSVYKIIKSHIDLEPYTGIRKIYLSRTHLKQHWRETGETIIENQFRKKKFQIIHPEELSLLDQLKLYISSDEFAATEGSISHNAIFCRPGSKVYLVRKSYYINGYQNIISEIADLEVTYIDAHSSNPKYQFSRESGPFYMCVTPELERFVGHKISHLPRLMSPSWWWYCNRNRKIVHFIKRIFGVE